MTQKHIFRYRQLAGEIETRIHSGTYQPGERLPSIRRLHKKLNLSISTIYQAYMELEAGGLIEARPKSGYYVSPIPLNRLQAPVFDKELPATPRKVELAAMVNSVVAAISNPRMLPLGSSATAAEILPLRAFSRIIKGMNTKRMQTAFSYSLTEGLPELRRQIALRTLGLLEQVTAEDIVITNGCSEAVTLCLHAVAKAGDTIAIETPTHFGFLQLLKELGMLVVEVPTHPRYGLDIGELENVLRKNPVKACLFMPNFQNPLGSLMPDEKKAELARLIRRFNVPVIEDDICGELYYEGSQRPRLLKAFDTDDLVMTCSSFSKILAPGLRIGWVIPGRRFRDKILRLKAGTTVCTSTLDQYMIARFLAEGGGERHLRSLRTIIKKQTFRTALAVQKYFSEGTRLAVPQGGSLLWVQLPEGVDGLAVYKTALSRNISILPGVVCSASGRFTDYIRLGCGHPFTPEMEKGVETLGQIVAENGAFHVTD